MGDDLTRAIAQAAGATSLEELGADAFESLARALRSCPVFLAKVGADLSHVEALGGRHREVFAAYVRDALLDDPLWHAALRAPGPVCLLEQLAEPTTVRESRVYREFHRPHDFEHHVLLASAERASPRRARSCSG